MAPDAAEFINPIRDCYEAYVLYSFIMVFAQHTLDVPHCPNTWLDPADCGCAQLLEAYTGDLNELLPKLSPVASTGLKTSKHFNGGYQSFHCIAESM